MELDSCLQGLGAKFNSQVYTIVLPLGYKGLGIVHLEMLNSLVAIRVWAKQLSGKAMLVHCDNQAVVAVLRSSKTRDMTLAAIARNIAMVTARYDIDLRTIHILAKLM